MADQNITALPATTTPESSDQLLLVGATEEKLIDYDKLADAILGKIASKNFTLDQGNKTLLQALNELNSNSLSDVKNVNWTASEKKCEIDVSSFTPLNYHYGFLTYGWNGKIELLPFSFSVIPSDTFVSLKENSSVTAVIENNKITFSIIDDTFWGGIRVLLFS